MSAPVSIKKDVWLVLSVMNKRLCVWPSSFVASNDWPAGFPNCQNHTVDDNYGLFFRIFDERNKCFAYSDLKKTDDNNYCVCEFDFLMWIDDAGFVLV